MTSAQTSSQPIDPSVLLAQRGWLARVARELVSDAHLREDLVQDTLCAALQSPPRAESTGVLRAWLGRVLRHRAGNVQRRGSLGRWHEQDRSRLLAPRIDERLELEGRLTRAIAALRQSRQEAVVLRFLEELSPRDIATRLGISELAVRQRVSRGLADLRAELDAGSTEPGEWRATCIGLLQPSRPWRLPFGLDPRLALLSAAAALVPVTVWGQTGTPPIALEAIAGAASASMQPHPRRISPSPTQSGEAAHIAHSAQQEPDDPTAAEGTPLPAAIDAYLEPLVDSGLFSGTVLVAQGDEVLHEGAYGFAHIEQSRAVEIDTGFKLMSVTKALTALAVMRLHEELGENLLDRPVVDLLNPWPEEWDGVTVRHLLQHTSGIPNFEVALGAEARSTGKLGFELWPDALEKIQERSLRSQPGEQFAYSNANFVLLATILDANAHLGFQDYLEQSIFRLANMWHTTHDDGSQAPGLATGYFRGRNGEPDPSEQDMSVILGAGDLISTVHDLYALDRALANGDLLQPASFEEMTVPGNARGSYGLGWQLASIAGQACVYHTGGSNGYVANFLRFPAADACIVVLSNFAFAPTGRIGNDLAALLFDAKVTLPQVSAPSTLERCCGVYASPERPDQPALIERSGDTLMWFPVNDGTHRVGGNLLMPLGSGRFAVPHSAEILEFALDAENEEPSPLVLISHGATDSSMVRLSDPADAWYGAQRHYKVTPRMGSAVSIERDEFGILHLVVRDGWPPSTEVIPLTSNLGLARVFAGGGSTFRLERNASGEVTGFLWRDLSNVDFVGRTSR